MIIEYVSATPKDPIPHVIYVDITADTRAAIDYHGKGRCAA